MLGARIAALRRQSGISQQQLAAYLDVSSSAVGMYEQGRREPSAILLVQMAQLFGVSTDYLLTGCATQLQDISHLHHVVQDAQEKLGAELLLRGPDGTARAPTDADLAAFLAALLA